MTHTRVEPINVGNLYETQQCSRKRVQQLKKRKKSRFLKSEKNVKKRKKT